MTLSSVSLTTILLAGSLLPLAGQAPRGGEHDFDFEIGNWKTHISRLERPLSGSTKWIEYEGTSVVRKVWNGRANTVELEVDGPDGRHIQGLSLRLYNPRSRQWSLNFVSSASGTMSVPTVGRVQERARRVLRLGGVRRPHDPGAQRLEGHHADVVPVRAVVSRTTGARPGSSTGSRPTPGSRTSRRRRPTTRRTISTSRSAPGRSRTRACLTRSPTRRAGSTSTARRRRRKLWNGRGVLIELASESTVRAYGGADPEDVESPAPPSGTSRSQAAEAGC